MKTIGLLGNDLAGHAWAPSSRAIWYCRALFFTIISVINEANFKPFSYKENLNDIEKTFFGNGPGGSHYCIAGSSMGR